MEMTMAQTTAAVKKALLGAGFVTNNLSVKRGRRTAAFWVYISLDMPRHSQCSCGEPDEYGRRETCENCKNAWRFVYKVVNAIALKASGRDAINYDHQNITIQLGFSN